jgi:hypothetical protein
MNFSILTIVTFFLVAQTEASSWWGNLFTYMQRTVGYTTKTCTFEVKSTPCCYLGLDVSTAKFPIVHSKLKWTVTEWPIKGKKVIRLQTAPTGSRIGGSTFCMNHDKNNKLKPYVCKYFDVNEYEGWVVEEKSHGKVLKAVNRSEPLLFNGQEMCLQRLTGEKNFKLAGCGSSSTAFNIQ